MKRYVEIDFENQSDPDCTPQSPAQIGELPNRLLTAFEVAEFVGCHEETVRARTCAVC